MAESESYNGWTNYETWTVNQWLNSEEVPYHLFMRIVRASDMDDLQKADALKDWVTRASPLEQARASMYTDLLGRALERVNWLEIVEGATEE